MIRPPGPAPRQEAREIPNAASSAASIAQASVDTGPRLWCRHLRWEDPVLVVPSRARRVRGAALGLSAVLAAGCVTAPARPLRGPLDAPAEAYVKLALAIGAHDPEYVSAYYGPPAWRDEAAREKLPLAEIVRRAGGALREVEAACPAPGPFGAWRCGFLRAQLEAVRAEAERLSGRRFTFEEEARAVYGIALAGGGGQLEAEAAVIAALVPGEGDVAARLRAYLKRFEVPEPLLGDVLARSIAECRARTARHVSLPPGERVDLERVSGRPWAMYSGYRGDFRTVLQVNSDVPLGAWPVLVLGCHEAYPGHHVLSTLLEERLVRPHGLVELAILPLFSPFGVVVEGSAVYAPELAYPGDEATQFERGVLFPAAGLDPAEATRYVEVARRVGRLRYLVRLEAARRLLDGEADRDATRAWLERVGFYTRPEADRLLRFVDGYRAYAAAYVVGPDLVRARVERAGTDPAARWRAFEELLVPPTLPADLAPR
jgi:hypothetical protein